MKSAFGKYNPWVNLIYIIGNIILASILQHPILLCAGIIGLLGVHYITDQGKQLKSYLKFYMMMCLINTLLNPLLSHRGQTILFYLNGQCITLEATIYGFIMGLSLFVVLSSFSLYQVLMTSDKLMYLFSSMLPRMTLVVMLSLRIVPLLKQRIAEIREVQFTQGILTKKKDIRLRSKTAMESLNTLVGWSLEELMQTAKSIRSRGYSAEKKRTFYFRYHIERRDLICVGIQILLIISILYLWYKGSYAIYPRVTLAMTSKNTIILLMVYLIYIGLPLWIEGGEIYKWH